MANITNMKDVFHRIRVKIYPNYLPGVEGAYIARTKWRPLQTAVYLFSHWSYHE
jgi:hypothetical protein